MATGDADNDDDWVSEFEQCRARERVFVWIMFGLAVCGFFAGIVFGHWMTR